MSQRIRMDANVILRFLRNDNAKQTALAAELFKKAQAGEVILVVSAVTINEVFTPLEARSLSKKKLQDNPNACVGKHGVKNGEANRKVIDSTNHLPLSPTL